jgi:eukaryotic-like serine/threonine-protein kinase
MRSRNESSANSSRILPARRRRPSPDGDTPTTRDWTGERSFPTQIGVIWRFLGFELDEERFELRRDGEVVELRRKVFDVLHYLVRQGERLVTKEELLERVWPGETIHEAVVAQNIAILRKVFADSRGKKLAIQTVHGRGYRFVAPVESAQPSRPQPTAAEPSELSEPPFVGREHTLRELTKLLESAIAGRGEFALISGEAGIGKTRTAEELAKLARALGARAYTGRCYEAEGAPAYWPWIQILRQATEGCMRTPLSRIDAPSAEVAHLLGRLSESPNGTPLDSAEARFRLFDGITSFLSQLARKQPLMLVFDDIHWADAATLHLLRFLAREVRALPMLVVATARELDARSAPTSRALLAGATHVHRLYLDGLTPESIAELAAHAEHSLSGAALREVHSLTEGNPFFVQQVLRLFADDGGRSRIDLPQRVREIIGLRLHGLDARAQRLLALASAIGQRFSLAVLEQIAEAPRAQTLELLEGALALRILREPSEAGSSAARPLGTYEFAHALIREYLYATLEERERLQIHARVGRALEQLYALAPRDLTHETSETGQGDQLNELAYHFCRAAPLSDVERAVDYCTRAADHALHVLAFEQAVSHYESALEALSCRLPIDEEKRFALKLALGSAQFRAGDDGNPALLSAADIARRLDRPDLLAEVVLSLLGRPRFRQHGRTENPALEPLLEEALRVLPAKHRLRSRLLSARALNGPLESPLTEKRAFCAEALALARDAGDADALYDALLAEVRLAQDPARTRERLRLANELLEVAKDRGHKERIFTAHEMRVQPLLALGDVRAADAAIAACGELARELRLPRCTLQMLRFRLEKALAEGRYDEVSALTKEAVDTRGKALPSPGYLVSLFAWVTYARTFRGDRAWFERHIDHMASKAYKSRLMRAHVAFVYASFGEFVEARRCYAPLLAAEVLDASDDDDWLLCLTQTADAIAAVGDRAAAEQVYPRLAPHAALNVTHFDWWVYFGSVAHWLGRLAVLLGEPERAADHYEAALAQNALLGARPAFARSALAYAQLLLGGNRRCTRGEQLRERAESIAIELGMRHVARDAAALRGGS